MIKINNSWEFTSTWNKDFLAYKKGSTEKVRIPHTVKEMPLHYSDDKDYQMISGYRRKLMIPADAKGKRVFLQFDACAHIATLYVNRKEVMTHEGGYTAFRAEITDFVKPGNECEIALRLDSTENGSIPPFGFVIDYLTYGGIYRDVYLDIREKDYIEDLYITTPETDTVNLKITIDGNKKLKKKVKIKDQDNNVIKELSSEKNELAFKVDRAKPWSIDKPNLYECEVKLSNGDKKTVRFGFRTIRYETNGFYLNDEKVFIRGLDRHQCFPYIGYAATDSLQKEDARILKEELCCNAVRTSHYPQAQSFIDACDELGLLVFTEIPGWQHIGNKAWKQVACKHAEEMVLQYRNHPSIVLWGVRINESQDDDEFYTETNRIAHELDPSRPTSGVRYITKSSLIDDVYAFNDFSHTGNNPGVRKKKDVTPDMNKPLIISEANGHMFPTKAFDKWSLRQEHALRHARVMNDAMADGEHIGVFQWCMFDYATHKDFGSGDRICYHGVMDAFRNPKLAASVYAMQGDKQTVLEVGSPMDIGDYPAGNIDKIFVFSNADSVKLYKNGTFVKEYKESEYKALNHGPMWIDDTIGDLLRTNEGYTGKKERGIHDCLVAAGRYGIDNLPASVKVKIALLSKRYKLSYAELKFLYDKYVGNWGGEATVWRFDAIRNGEVVKSKTVCPVSKLHLEVKASASKLHDDDTYDMAAIRIRVLDENDNIAPYAQLPLYFLTNGPIEICGPDMATAEGGMSGTYIKTIGKKGKATLTVYCEGLEVRTLDFVID